MGGHSQRNWSLHCDGVHIAPPLSSQPQEQSKGSSSFSRNKISNTASGLCLALHLAVNSVTGPPPSHCVPPQKCQQAIPVSHQETHVVQRLRAQTRTESKGGQPGMWKGLPSILSLTLGGRGALWSSSRVRQSQLGWCFPYGHSTSSQGRLARTACAFPIRVFTEGRSHRRATYRLAIPRVVPKGRPSVCFPSPPWPARATLMAQSSSEGPGAEVQVLPCLGQTYKKFVTRKMFHCAIS